MKRSTAWTAVLNAAGGHTRYWLLLLILTPLLFRDTFFSISVSHMSEELVQFMSQLLNLVMFIQIFTHVKFAENKRSFYEFILRYSLYSALLLTRAHRET